MLFRFAIALVLFGCGSDKSSSDTAKTETTPDDTTSEVTTGDETIGALTILYSGRVGGVSHLYTMRADGTDIVQLTDDTTDDQTPEWSPDGNRITCQRRHT